MNDDDRRIWWYWLIIGVLGILMLFMITACRTVYVPQPVYHEVHDTIKQVTVRDSIVEHYIYERDSSSFQQKGDTVTIEKWHWYRDYRYEKILQAQIDSLSHLERDTVTVTVEVPIEVQVPRDYTLKDRILFKFAGFGIFCFVLLLLFIAYRVIKNKITRH